MKPLLILLHTPADILNISQSYISIIMLFCCVTFAYNLLSSMLRAIGNSYIPLYSLMIASVLNVILDIFLVKGLNMGVKGAYKYEEKFIVYEWSCCHAPQLMRPGHH